MGAFVRGDVVVTPFPYSDLSDNKKRPAVVLSSFPEAGIVLLAHVTSRKIQDSSAVELTETDFESGGLRATSYVRTNYLFSCAEKLVLYVAGKLTKQKLDQVIERVVFKLTQES